MNRDKIVVLASGGIDSTTTLAVGRDRGYDCYALSFDYGQRHVCELEHCARVIKSIGAIEHLIFPIDMRPIGGSALTDSIDVPADRKPEEMTADIPVTYVPARNTIFLSIALAWAEVLEAGRIYIGANAVDYSGYPDCRPEFIEAFQTMANLATRTGVSGPGIIVEAPLIDMTKAEIIQLGVSLGVDYALTFSCYDPSDDGLACGRCDSCQIRRTGFSQAGVADPTDYVTEPGA